jgi:hypothetical protein
MVSSSAMMCMATSSAEARWLARELPDVTDHWDGDGIGDSADSDGEPIDDQVSDSRAGPPSRSAPQIPLPNYGADDVGIGGVRAQ